MANGQLETGAHGLAKRVGRERAGTTVPPQLSGSSVMGAEGCQALITNRVSRDSYDDGSRNGSKKRRMIVITCEQHVGCGTQPWQSP